MTTYQDQPWARRAVRDDDQAPTPDAADTVDSDTEADDDAPFAPRATPLSPRGAGEPLNYVTQQRASDADLPAFRPRRQPSVADESTLPITEQMAANETPRYRARDYSPEGRSGVPSWAPTYTHTPNPYSGGGSSLDWHTQVRPEAGVASDAPTADGAVASHSEPDVTPHPHSHVATDEEPATPIVISTPMPPVGGSAYERENAEAFIASARQPATGSPDIADTPIDSAPAAPPDEAPIPRSAAPSAPPMAGAQVNVERTVTRRELRALRAAQEAAEAAALGATGASVPHTPSPFIAQQRVSEPPTYEDLTIDTAATHTAATDTAATHTAATDSRAAHASAPADSTASAPADTGLDAWVASVFEGAHSAAAASEIPPVVESVARPESRIAPAPLFDHQPETREPATREPAAHEPLANEPVAQAPLAPEPFPQEPFSHETFAQEPVEQGRLAPEPDAPAAAAFPPPKHQPVPLVEPSGPASWSDGARPLTSPSVLDALFAPPTAADPVPGQAGASAPTTAPSPAPDPFAFLSSNAPSASERVELPAPPSWQTAASILRQGRLSDPPLPASAAPRVDDSAEPVVAPAPADDEPIVAELIEDEPTPESDEAVGLHPVVIDAQPLPAEPITLPSINETELAATGTDQIDDVAPGGFVASLEVGGGHGVVTTNALVLPSIPSPELVGPLTSTGEIMITGSIDLPRSLSSTGAHPAQLDESALDHELDPGDHQVVSTESQPVRAIRAVSTHGSTRGMITNTKPRGNRALTYLIVATAGMAVIVGALLVVGLVTHAF